MSLAKWGPSLFALQFLRIDKYYIIKYGVSKYRELPGRSTYLERPSTVDDKKTPVDHILCGIHKSNLHAKSIMYENGKYTSKKLNATYLKAQKAYRENVDAAMCSDNPKGIFSMYQSMMLLAASVIPHKSPQNDALVEFQSCSKGLDTSKFGKSYKDTFYKPELNHADTVFLTSDGWLQDSQKPAKWFECLL